MGKISLFDRMKYWLVEPHYPNVGIEINSDAVRLAVITAEQGTISVPHLDSEPLPPGTVQINPFHPNVQSLEVMAEAIRQLWNRNQFKSPKVCLLLQDRSALTFQVSLEHPPASRQECLDLIRFKLKKSVPFRIEEAQISYFDNAGAPEYASGNLWVTVMNHAVLSQYEQLISSSLESECGLVDLATFNLMNLASHEIKKSGLQAEDHMFVNLNHDYISIAITRKDRLMFYRSRDLERHTGAVQEALEEVYPTTMFYVDKLGGHSLAKAFLYSVERPEELSEKLRSELGLSPVILTAHALVQTKFDPQAHSFLKGFTPILGTLMSRKVEFL